MTGFEDHPTADEVLDGVDLTGRTALVTGGYSGIGPATVVARWPGPAPACSPRPAAPSEAARGAGRTRRRRGRRDGPADQASVAAYAETLLDDGTHLDIVINSAGVMATPGDPDRREGWELQFATNHLGHYALVNRLWPLLDGGRPRRERVLRRAPPRRHPVGRPVVHPRLRQVGGLRAVQDRQRAVRGPPRRGSARSTACGRSRCTPARSSPRSAGTCRPRTSTR